MRDPDNEQLYQAHQGRTFMRPRFPPRLEQQYRESLTRDFLPFQKASAVVVLLVWALFMGLDLLHFDLQAGLDGWLVLLAGVRVGILLLLTGLVLQMLLCGIEAYSVRFASWVLLLVLAGGMASIFIYRIKGLYFSDGIFALLGVAAFFPLGVSFRRSLLVALALFALWLLVGYPVYAAEAPEQYGSVSLVFLLSILACATGGYIRDQVKREQFLLRELLKWQSSHDPLTGLHNRRAFDQHVQTVLGLAAREGASLAQLIIDLDYFKQYNDYYGHQAGDAALCAVAGVLEAFARRPLDIAARLGGEEFTLVLYDVEEAHLETVALRIVQQVRALEVPHARSAAAPVLTVSVGACLFHLPVSEALMYRRSDELLYEAKRLGRNRSCVAVEGSPVALQEEASSALR